MAVQAGTPTPKCRYRIFSDADNTLRTRFKKTLPDLVIDVSSVPGCLVSLHLDMYVFEKHFTEICVGSQTHSFVRQPCVYG